MTLISSFTKLPLECTQCDLPQFIATVEIRVLVKVVSVLIGDIAYQPSLTDLLKSADCVLLRQNQKFHDNVGIETYEPSVVDEIEELLENVHRYVAECAVV